MPLGGQFEIFRDTDAFFIQRAQHMHRFHMVLLGRFLNPSRALGFARFVIGHTGDEAQAKLELGFGVPGLGLLLQAFADEIRDLSELSLNLRSARAHSQQHHHQQPRLVHGGHSSGKIHPLTMQKTGHCTQRPALKFSIPECL